MKKTFLLWLGLACWACSSALFARTLPYPVLFIHGIWSNAETWETAISELTARGYQYGGVIQAKELPAPGADSTPSTAVCVTSRDPDRKNTTVYLPDCYSGADFYVWETRDYCAQPILCANDNLSFSQLGGEVKFAIDLIKSWGGTQPNNKVTLVAHSMGGIAARHYLQNLHRAGADYENDVAKLITIGTPHFGSITADLCGASGKLTCVDGSLEIAQLSPVLGTFAGVACQKLKPLGSVLCSLAATSRLRTDSGAVRIMNGCADGNVALCTGVSLGKPHTLPGAVNYVSLVGGQADVSYFDMLVSGESQSGRRLSGLGDQSFAPKYLGDIVLHTAQTSASSALSAIFAEIGASGSGSVITTGTARVDKSIDRFVMSGAVYSSTLNVGQTNVTVSFRYAASMWDVENNYSSRPAQTMALAPGESRQFSTSALSDAALPFNSQIFYRACVRTGSSGATRCGSTKTYTQLAGSTPMVAPNILTNNPLSSQALPANDKALTTTLADVQPPFLLSWTSVPNATRYKVHVARTADVSALPTGTSTADCAPCKLYYTTEANSAMVGADQVAPGQSYAWVVSAENDDQIGYWSNVATFTVAPANPSLLPAPIISSPTNAAMTTGDQPTLSWGGVSTATSYRVFIAESGATLPNDPTVKDCSGCVINAIAVGETLYIPNAGVLQPGHTYFWRVKARSPSQYGTPSAIQSFTVPQPSTACTYYFLTPQLTVPTVGATINVTINTREGCSPTVASNQPWCVVSGVPSVVNASGTGLFTLAVGASGQAASRTCQITMGTATLTVTQPGTAPATSYALTVSQQPGGSTTPSGTSSIAAGTYTTVTATPLPGYSFAGWYENSVLVWSGQSYSFSMSSARTLVANFAATGQYNYVGLANVPDGRDYDDVRWRASGSGLTTFTWQKYNETIAIPAATSTFRVDCADTPFAQAVPQTFNQGNGYNPGGYWFTCNYVSKGVSRLNLSMRTQGKIAASSANGIAALNDGRVVVWGSRQLTDLTNYSQYANARGWGYSDQVQSRPVFIDAAGVTAVDAESIDANLPSLLVRGASGWKGWGATRGPFSPTALPDLTDVILKRGPVNLRTGGRIFYQNTYKGTVSNAVDVAGTSDDMVFALRSDGSVVGFPGANESSSTFYCVQLGQDSGAYTNCTRPNALPLLNRVVAISASSYHGYAVRDDGTVWVWGYNVSPPPAPPGIGGRTGFAPVQVPGVSNAKDILTTIDGTTFVFTTAGLVYAWGTNPGGRLGLPINSSPTTNWTPHLVAGMSGIREIAASNDGATGVLLAIDNAGFVWTTGVLSGWNGTTAGTGTDLTELTYATRVVCPSGYSGFLNVDNFDANCTASPTLNLTITASSPKLSLLVDGQPVVLPFAGTYSRGQTVRLGLGADVGQAVGLAGDILVAQRQVDLQMNRDWYLSLRPGNCLGVSLLPPGTSGVSAVYATGDGGRMSVPVYDSVSTTCHWQFATSETWLTGDGDGYSGGSFQLVVQPNPTALQRVGYLQLLGPTGGNTGVVIQAPGSADTQPDAFAFATRLFVSRGTMVQSSAATIQGINAPAQISISSGSEYSIGCNGSFTSAPGSVVDGTIVCVRHTSSNAYGGTTTSTLTVGGVSGTFTSVAETLTCKRPLSAHVEPLRAQRYVAGVRGDAMVAGTLLPGESAGPTSASEQTRFDTTLFTYDFNGDGVVTDVDVTLYLRYALGVRGAALTDGLAIGSARSSSEIVDALATCQ